MGRSKNRTCGWSRQPVTTDNRAVGPRRATIRSGCIPERLRSRQRSGIEPEIHDGRSLKKLAQNATHQFIVCAPIAANCCQSEVRDLRSMKTADEVAREISRYLMPPRGAAIKVSPANGPYDPNWFASATAMDISRLERFEQLIVELRRSDRIIEWSGIPGPPGRRKVRIRVGHLWLELGQLRQRSECARPGARKNGATCRWSPSATPTSMMPLSISHSTRSRGSLPNRKG